MSKTSFTHDLDTLVLSNSSVDSTAILDGFTISGGNANTDPYLSGGGMYNFSSSPTLTNVTFSANTTANSGGGMYNDNSSPSLTNVTFSGNSATGAAG